MDYDIFISYRRTDQPVARELVQQLESRGVRVWWDQKIEGGEDWRDAIVAGLESAHALVILFSSECNESKQLKKEMAIADTLDKLVIPVLIEDTKPKGHFLYELAARNWIQVFPNPESRDSDLAERL
ncbi:MAG: toll/interleukin-1 receptor domain-containing protein, partial [Pseudomonadota bacterium]